MVQTLKEIYAQPIDQQYQKRYADIEQTFEKTYGTKPDFYVRAPGRVNLIGEHIDYEGYSVLPMAIAKEIILAVSLPNNPKTNNVIQLANAENDQFPARTLAIDPRADIDRTTHDWSHYFLCGYKAAWLLTGTVAEKDPLPGVPMNLVCCGNVPLASGLSSSSAFVVASTIASLMAAKLWNERHGGALNAMSIVQQDFDAVAVAELCRVGEQFIGTMSGGMDQAISCLGQRGIARVIHFNPLRTESVRLPDNMVVVIADSLTKAEKAKSAKTHYNKRVVECMLASKLMAHHLNLSNWKQVCVQFGGW